LIRNINKTLSLLTKKNDFARFAVGDRAQIIHLPTRNGEQIKIPALVREVLPDGYRVETEFQMNIKVKLKDLIPA